MAFTISRRDFEVYSTILHKWGVQPDVYDILLNLSAEENIASGSLEVTGGDQMFFFHSMMPLVQFVKCPAFHEYLRKNKPEWMCDFFDLGKRDFLVLMLPLPFYRLTDPLQGDPMFTMEEIQEIVRYCNENRGRQSIC